MKQPPLLVLDCHYLCHRAFHSQPKSLSWKGKVTGVIYGFFHSLISLQNEFSTHRVAFCFEAQTLKRKQIYPRYKQHRQDKRREQSEGDKRAYNELQIQIAELRNRHLLKIGFRNIFTFNGMESDDIMAQIAKNAKADEEIILVTSDADLWQCLRPNVSIYQPTKQKLLTYNWFCKLYGFTPPHWAIVKAITGCAGDGVQGIRGIGDKTAVKYLQGKLEPDSNAMKIMFSEEGKETVRRNRRLVELPYEGCPQVSIYDGPEVTFGSWVEVCIDLGFKSLMSTPPQIVKRYG